MRAVRRESYVDAPRAVRPTRHTPERVRAGWRSLGLAVRKPKRVQLKADLTRAQTSRAVFACAVRSHIGAVHSVMLGERGLNPTVRNKGHAPQRISNYSSPVQQRSSHGKASCVTDLGLGSA